MFLVPGAGVTMLVKDVEVLAVAFGVLANRTMDSIALINNEMRALREAVIENRLGLDLAYSKDGGLCKKINVSCCFYIPDYQRPLSDQIESIRSVVSELKIPSDHASEGLFGWLSDMGGPILSLIAKIGTPILLVIVVISVLVSACRFLISRALTGRMLRLRRMRGDDRGAGGEETTSPPL